MWVVWVAWVAELAWVAEEAWVYIYICHICYTYIYTCFSICPVCALHMRETNACARATCGRNPHQSVFSSVSSWMKFVFFCGPQKWFFSLPLSERLCFFVPLMDFVVRRLHERKFQKCSIIFILLPKFKGLNSKT